MRILCFVIGLVSTFVCSAHLSNAKEELANKRHLACGISVALAIFDAAFGVLFFTLMFR